MIDQNILENRNIELVKQYVDLSAKVEYLINKHGFVEHPLASDYIMKNDLIIIKGILQNYHKEQLDTLNFLANKYFVYDPFIEGGYVSEFMILKLEEMHTFTLKEIRLMYNYSRDSFYENTTIN